MKLFYISLVVGAFLIYFYLAAIPSLVTSSGSDSELEQKPLSDGIASVKTSDSVAVTVFRDRWYGQLVESYGAEKSVNLRLFNRINIPLMVNNIKLEIYHATFLFSLVLVNFLIYNQQKNMEELKNEQEGSSYL